MFWIVGTLVRIATFPGAIMQTVAMKLFCDLFAVEVYHVDYLKGSIDYGRLRDVHTAFVISVAPFFLNTILCMVLTFPFAFGIAHGSGTAVSGPSMATGYLGVCLGMHAFPSKAMMDELAANAEPSHGGGAFNAIYGAIGWVFWLANVLSVVWFDAIYTIIIAATLPLAISG